MQVGLLTFHLCRNYGAMIQAYALCRVVQEMGHDARFIDYRGGPVDRLLFSKRRPWSLLPAMIRWRRLVAFRDQYLPQTTKTYHTDADLMDDPPDFDAYICGSDQIWNPYCKGFHPAYFLHFVPEDSARLIAYAPSFGDYQPGNEYDEKMAQYIKRFDCLSVREKSGQRIIQQLTGRSAEHVLDPCLLVDDYSVVSTPPGRKDDYIAAYMLNRSDEKIALLNKAKEKLGLPVISIGPTRLPGVNWMRDDAGVRRWLGHIQNARFVCTDSFHGTCLSILFRKEFLTVPHPTRNERIAGLLDAVGLSQRQAGNPEDPDTSTQFHETIDYDEVHSSLQELRAASLDYLQRALTGKARQSGRQMR